jgi:hypothetical protein
MDFRQFHSLRSALLPALGAEGSCLLAGGAYLEALSGR